MNKKLENRLRNKIRGIVETVVREETSGTLPANAKFAVVESFKQMKQMMGVLEGVLKDQRVSPDDFWETYDNVVDSLKKKIEQMDKTVNRSR